MDREELIAELQQNIRNRFMELSDEEKDLIRAGSGTPYANAFATELPNAVRYAEVELVIALYFFRVIRSPELTPPC